MHSQIIDALKKEILQRQKLTKTLILSEERLKQAQQLANMGVWEWDLETDETTWSAEMFEIYGITPEEFTGKGEDYLGFTHPDDQITQRANIEQAFAAAAQPDEMNSPLPKEFRIIRPNGSICYVRGNAVALVGKEGNPVRMLGILMDVSPEKEQEENLRFQKMLLQSQSEASPDGILVVSKEREWLSFNQRFIEMWQIPHDVAQSRSRELGLQIVLPQVVNADQFIATIEYLHEQTDESSHDEVYLKDGRIFDQYSQPVRDEAGIHYGRVWYYRDITPEKLAHQALQESESRFRNLMEGSIQGILIHQDNKPMFVNAAYAHALGYDSPKDILKLDSVIPLIASYEQERLMSYYSARISGKTAPMKYEYDAVRKDGSIVTLQQIVSTIQWDGELSVLATVIDVTPLKQAEASQKKIEQFNQKITASSLSGVYIYDLEKRKHVYINPQYQALIGYTLEELLEADPLSFLEAIHPDDRPLMVDHINALYQAPDNEILEIEYRTQKANGDWLWCLAWDTVFERNEAGQVTQFIGSILNITERKQFERSLKASENRYRSLFEQANDAIFVNTEDDRIIDVNQRACEMLGYSRDELLTMTVPDLQAPEIRRPIGTAIRYEIEHFEGTSFETVNIHRNGTHIPVEVNSSLIIDKDHQRLVLSVVRDITDRKKTEQALKESESRLEGIIASAMDAIIVINDQQEIELFNPTAERVFGYTAEQILGKPLSILMPERYRHVHKKHIERFGQTGVTNRPMGQDFLYGQRADGTEFPVEASISQVIVDGRHLYTAILRDITERKILEEQFYQAQKMEAIGLLAGGIAHDFNNLLVPIMMYSNMGMLNLPTNHQVYGYLQEIQDTAEKAKWLTQQILALSRKQVLALETLNLNDVVSDMGKLLRRLIGENIIFQMVLHNQLPLIEADQNQLAQVLMNMTTNARDAMPTGGSILIETESVRVTEVREGFPEDVEPSLYVCLNVSDTGSGMDEKTKQHLFDPFYTTKEVGKGTGLGLATVYNIVKQHKGYIQFESKVNRGTTFQLYFPVSSKEQTTKRTESPLPVMVSGQETILLVEDEHAVRVSLKQALELHGYTVLEANHGREALEIAATHEGTIHLLLTDMMMPHLNGHELRQRLIELFPTLKVLYISGYSGETIEHLTLSQSVDLLQKPFSIRQLIQKIAGVLTNEGYL